MKNTIKTKLAVIAMAGVISCSQAQAQGLGMRGAGDFEAGIGYMENSDRAFGFIKAQGVTYQDQVSTHKIGLEYIGYDETLDSALDTNILFTTIVLNYEVEYQLDPAFSVFGGFGLGGQYASLDSPVGELDNDIFGYAQVFVGARAHLTENLDFRAGVRRMFFDDYELLGVSGLKQEQTWGFDVGFTLRF